MSYLSRFLAWLTSFLSSPLSPPTDSGLILDHPEDLEKLPKHEIFAGGGEARDWRPFCPSFRYQGASMWCTAFAGASIGSIFDCVERGGKVFFSPLELFYRSNGQIYGNYLVSTAQAMRQALVLEAAMPTPVLDSWNQNILETWRNKSKAKEADLNFGKQFAVKEAASVKTDTASLRVALASSPLMVAIGIGRGYWNDPAPRQSSYNAFHAVVLTHIEEDGTKHIFDSLTQKQGFSGHHKLAPDYEILSALSFIDLPNDWQGIQETHETNTDALAHYGHVRVLAAEQLAAADLLVALKKNPTIAGLMGREWTVCTNAVAYGGYSVQDLLNHYTSIRRGKGPIWNLNRERKNQR